MNTLPDYSVFVVAILSFMLGVLYKRFATAYDIAEAYEEGYEEGFSDLAKAVESQLDVTIDREDK